MGCCRSWLISSPTARPGRRVADGQRVTLRDISCLLRLDPGLLRKMRLREDGLALSLAERLDGLANLGILVREDRGREQRGIDSAGVSDGERADRNAARHLHRR